MNGGVWADIDAEVLTGEFDMRVEGGSLSAVNPATKQARALEMLGTIVPVLTTYGYDPEPALRHIVRDLGYDPDQFLTKVPTPEPAPAPDMGAAMPPMGEAEALPPELAALLGGAAPVEAVPEAALLAGPAEVGSEELPPNAGLAGLL
jgi:hypothetical protein